MRKLFLSFLLLQSFLSFARVLTIDEASFTGFSDVSMKVFKDGSMEEHVRLTYYLKKPQAMQLGTFPIVYSPSYETMDFKKAYVVTKDKTYAPQKIEDKPIASTVLEGFDAKNRLVVNFSHVEVGSKIYLEYKITRKPLIKDFNSMVMGAWNYFPILKGSKVLIESERKLHTLFQSFKTDLAKKLNLKKSFDAKRKVYVYSLEATDNLYYAITDETHSYEEESLPYVAFATTDSYVEMIKPQLPRYLDKIKQPLPKAFKEYLKGVDKKEGLIKNVETLMATMMNHLRYSGDWRSVDGKMIPRDIAEVAKTGYGDCKDFSLLLASLLRELGYDAHQALVKRSRNYQPDIETELPEYGTFNHAITYANYNGQSYWFDPTNYLSFAKRPLDDISDRKALVLAPKPFLGKIPPIKPEENSTEVREEVTYDGNKKRHVDVERVYRGIASFAKHMNFYQISEQEGEDILLRSTVGDFELLAKHKLDFPKNLSRVVASEMKTRTVVSYYNPLIKTTAGYGVSVPTDDLVSFMSTFDPKKYECAGLKLGDIFQRKIYSTLKGKKLKSNESVIKSEIKSPWFDYMRTIEQKGDNILITQEVSLKKEVLKHSELSSSELKKLREDLRSKVDNIILIFE